ncbi:hypothetical protein BJF87_24210 [Gordonia sp. CNJ-863]|nr:hypothetical protein BJF87_24210 [Gordonia sp. CNJ-863]
MAARIDRSAGRVSRLYNSGVMPEPDHRDQSGQPYWTELTIDSWWAARNGFDHEDTPRYHRSFTDGHAPQLLEDIVIDVTLGMHRQRSEEMHARIYAGVDALGPVVLISPLRGDRATITDHGFALIATAVTKHSAHELEYETDTVWFLTVSGFWDGHFDTNSGAYPPPEANVWDMSTAVRQALPSSSTPYKLRSPVTADDVARLIGTPFDVFPEEHYTRDNVSRRRPLADSPIATRIEVDDAGLGTVIRHLGVVAASLTTTPEPHPALTIAAGVLADKAHAENTLATDNSRFLEHWATRAAHEHRSPTSTSPTRLAVEPWPRTLGLSELNLVHRHRPHQPLIAGRDPHRQPMTQSWINSIHPDTLTWFRSLTDYLDTQDPAPALLEALSAAHALLAQALRTATPDGPAHADYIADSHPHTVGRVRMTLHPGVATTYRSAPQLVTLDNLDSLPPGHRRRLTTLIAEARDPALAYYHDTHADLFVVETLHQRNDIEPGQWPNELVFEWPTGPLAEHDLAPGRRIVAPSTGYGDSVPAWITDGDNWTPIPSPGRGFTWGTEYRYPESLATTIAHTYLPDYTYSNDTAHQHRRHLNNQLHDLLAGRAEDIDIAVSTIAALVEHTKDLISQPIPEPATITTLLDAATTIAAHNHWRHDRTDPTLYTRHLIKIAPSIEATIPAMQALGWIPATTTELTSWNPTATTPRDPHEAYMRLNQELFNQILPEHLRPSDS